MRTKSLFALTAVATSISVATTTATASAYNKPSDAPSVVLGVMYFGDTRSNGDQSPFGSVWRLPSLLSQDVVTIAGQALDGGYIVTGIAGDVDDYDYAQKWRNNFESAGDNDGNYNSLSPEGARIRLRALNACAVCYFELGKVTAPWDGGPYKFTVESIQHAVGLGLTSVSAVQRKGTVRGTAYLTNGAPVPDGLDVALIVRKGDRKWVRVARSIGGQVSFQLRLPKKSRGKVRMSLSRGADSQYLAANTQSMKVRVK